MLDEYKEKIARGITRDEEVVFVNELAGCSGRTQVGECGGPYYAT
jgi:hypothetical protein